MAEYQERRALWKGESSFKWPGYSEAFQELKQRGFVTGDMPLHVGPILIAAKLLARIDDIEARLRQLETRT